MRLVTFREVEVALVVVPFVLLKLAKVDEAVTKIPIEEDVGEIDEPPALNDQLGSTPSLLLNVFQSVLDRYPLVDVVA